VTGEGLDSAAPADLDPRDADRAKRTMHPYDGRVVDGATVAGCAYSNDG